MASQCRFIDFLNQAHPSIKFTADWSREKINFLDVQVIREGDRLITDLFTKPTDTHQLLHRTSCQPGHTKKGIPYSQALRIRRICSEDRFFKERVGEVKGCLLNRGYGENEVLEQISKVRNRNRLTSFSMGNLKIRMTREYLWYLRIIHLSTNSTGS